MLMADEPDRTERELTLASFPATSATTGCARGVTPAVVATHTGHGRPEIRSQSGCCRGCGRPHVARA